MAKLKDTRQHLWEIVEPQSQIDPSFKTERRYTRSSAAEMRRPLIAQEGYAEADVPAHCTVSTKPLPFVVFEPYLPLGVFP